MIKILIADDHALIREGMRNLLRFEKDIKITGEAQNSSEVLRLLKKKEFDAVILDITLPGESGLDVLKEVKKHYPRLHVLLLTVHPEERFAVRAFRSGADGYVTKDSAPKELVKAIRKVVGGRKYVSEPLAEKLATGLLEIPAKAQHETLSDREFQIMCMIASGKNIKEIALELNISVGTVYSYRERILKKMKMKTNVELSHYAYEQDLIT